MSKEIYISSTPHETRLAIVENDALAEIYYERENEYTLAGSIYNGKVTRVLPGMQSAFVDIGLERDAFLYITDFMEEAGDSADFDTNGDSSRRGEGRRNSNPPVLEGTLAEPGQSSESAPYSGDRNDRNGRGDRGRRGRRDRGGNRDRQPVSDSAPQEQPSYAPSFEVQPPASSFTSPIGEAADDAQIGEGAPGADGLRRWRGRRGRRRGRGTGPREGYPQASSEVETDTQSTHAPEEIPAEPTDDSFDLDATASAPVVEETSSVVEPQDYNRRDRGDRNGRGDRGRDRNRGDRGGRNRDDRGPRAPRGFAPRTSYYGVDNAETETGETAAPSEPIILPGESLSKYRKEGDVPADAASVASKPADANIIIPAAPGFIIPQGWDGGSVLPGESLSRHRRAEHRGETNASLRNAPEPVAAPAPEPVVEQPAEVAAAVVETVVEPKAEPIAESVEARSEELIAPEVAEVPESQAEPAEYEPTEDTAVSYRVDPVAPSEYRQSAPALDTPEETPEPVAESASTAEPLSEAITAPEEPIAADAHELTTLHATGELTTEAPAAAFIPEEQATEPIHHETVILDPAENAAETAAVSATISGEFEEEFFDEEDFDATLHASSIEEMDDFDEEETLEGAADLGTMLREMSIDEITSSGSEDEEEDDFEEEDAVSDPAGFQLSEEDLEESDTEEDVVREDFSENNESAPDSSSFQAREIERRSSRRDGGRRDGRRGSRFGRARSAGGSGDRERSGGGRDHRGGRGSMQSTDLPAISELLKPGQEILVQIAKEPIAKKGARITSHIALPGRFLVFMPTVNHTGVSRKIESDSERRRLKEILLSEKGDASGGFIVRTAASGASEEELRSDLRFLLNLWADIKQRSDASKSPALIYHDLNLVERVLRDQVTDNFSAIWVDSETDYERILRFLQRFQPSLIRRVKLYSKETPLFEQFGITEEINKALRSKVWLKSGGSIVINQTEALVAIDINTGKYVGKTARLEDTIVKTNLDAIPEIVRQIRLRDLGGIIIIDFIDMDERKNRNRVMAALEEELKNDRAPSKILQFNDFGLVAITRKRVKQSLERTLSTTCGVCQGTGMTKSPITVCNDIYIEMRKMQKHLDRGDVMLRVNPEVVKQLKAPGTKWLQEMEEMVGKTILVKSDPSLHPEQFDIH